MEIQEEDGRKCSKGGQGAKHQGLIGQSEGLRFYYNWI